MFIKRDGRRRITVALISDSNGDFWFDGEARIVKCGVVPFTQRRRPEKLHAVSDDLGTTLQVAIWHRAFPFAGPQAALDENLPTLFEIFAAAQRELASDHDPMPFSPFLPLPSWSA
jgi:hypothetical protein